MLPLNFCQEQVLKITCLCCQNLGHGAEAVAAVEGAAASSDEHVGDHTDTPAVGGRRHLRALQHLGRDELQRPAHLAQLQHALLWEPARQGEVGDLELGVLIATGEDDAEGLEVKMDYATRVDVLGSNSIALFLPQISPKSCSMAYPKRQNATKS